MLRFAYAFVSGFLLMLTLNFFNDWSYEREVLVHLKEHIYAQCKTRDVNTLMDTALHYSTVLQSPSTEVFGNSEFTSFKKYFTTNSFQNYYFGKGACGAYSTFFIRLLSAMGFQSKVVQVTVNGKRGGHMSVVVMHQGKLLLVDPLFNHNFKDSNGNMSDINDVAKNWNSYYKYHLPANYVPDYNYQQGWTHSNWNKFGAFSRGIYNVACKYWGKQKVDQFCLYYQIQGINKYYMLICFFLFIFTLVKAIQLNFPLNKYTGILPQRIWNRNKKAA